jgi:hypothetical protein
MAEQYYFSQGNEEFGPYSAAQMRQLAAAGRIKPADLVWQSGTDRRVPAAKVGNLFFDRPTAAPPAAEEPPAEAPAELPTEAPSEPAPEAAAAEPENTPEEVSAPSRQRPPQPARRKRRVVSIKGAVVLGQDGVEVKYRKKCPVCGREDNHRSTAKIPLGILRNTFYCPTCRRVQMVEIVGAG